MNHLTIDEILTLISKLDSKEEKIKTLITHQNPLLLNLLKYNFSKKINFALPSGTPPYRVSDAPIGYNDTNLYVECRRLYLFLEGGNNDLKQDRREMLFIQLLESVSAGEAEVLLAVKDKNLGKKYKITKAMVKKAFPTLLQDDE